MPGSAVRGSKRHAAIAGVALAPVILCLSLVGGCVSMAPDPAVAAREVTDRERAFASTMARRDFAAFSAFVADEAIFFNGAQPIRGRAAIAEAWRGFYTAPEPPFSWEPDSVEALASGTLVHSTGPVRNAQGKLIARFNSVWRRDADGVWRVVFDRGTPACDCAPAR